MPALGVESLLRLVATICSNKRPPCYRVLTVVLPNAALHRYYIQGLLMHLPLSVDPNGFLTVFSIPSYKVGS